MDIYKDLEEMYETLSRELKKANEKIDGGDITAGDMSYIDEITHSLKSIKTIMAMMDSEYSNDEYSRMVTQEAIPMPGGVDVIRWDVMHQMDIPVEEDIQGMII